MDIITRIDLNGNESEIKKIEPVTVKKGWLRVRNEILPIWRMRMFVLKNDGALLGFTTKDCTDDFLQQKYTVRRCKVKPLEGNNKFVISDLKGTKGKERQFLAETSEERESWILAIKKLKTSLDVRKIDLKNLEFVKLLGKGSYGDVFLCKDTLTSAPYAVKVLDKAKCSENAIEMEKVIVEREILCTVNHPFIISLKCSFQNENKFFFVMDFANGGDLFYHIYKESKVLPDTRTRFYAAELVLALGYLHDQGILYRDLKVENILLDEEGHIKLTDFGLSRNGLLDRGLYSNTFCGTIQNCAPELLQGCYYNQSVDWWSLGIVMHEMMIGRPPYRHRNSYNLCELIVNQELKLPNGLSREAKSLLNALLTKDPKKRLGSSKTGTEDIKSHPYFSQINWIDMMDKKIKPPFKPKINHLMDTQYFEREYTDQTVDKTWKDESRSCAFHFNGFSFYNKNY